jgi:hypothetical protein
MPDAPQEITWYAWEVIAPDGKVSLRPFRLEALPFGCARVVESVTLMIAQQKGERVRLVRLAYDEVLPDANGLPHPENCHGCVTRKAHLETPTRDLLKPR